MATVALITSGSELHRQPYADVVSFFERCLAEPVPLRHEFSEARLVVYADDEVDHLLNGVDPRAHSCLVFASNALMSPAIATAVRQHDESLRRFVRRGGGVVM